MSEMDILVVAKALIRDQGRARIVDHHPAPVRWTFPPSPRRASSIRQASATPFAAA